MLMHQRANRCGPAITAENQYACYDLSLQNKRQKSYLLTKLNPPEQLIYPPEKSRMLPTDPLFTL